MTAAAAPITKTFTAVADTYVDASKPSSIYGNRITVRVDGAPITSSYVRFDVTGLTTTPGTATLRLFANSGQSIGYGVFAVTDDTWSEKQVTYSNARALRVPSPLVRGHRSM
jgi:hypothetical protein